MNFCTSENAQISTTFKFEFSYISKTEQNQQNHTVSPLLVR